MLQVTNENRLRESRSMPVKYICVESNGVLIVADRLVSVLGHKIDVVLE